MVGWGLAEDWRLAIAAVVVDGGGAVDGGWGLGAVEEAEGWFVAVQEAVAHCWHCCHRCHRCHRLLPDWWPAAGRHCSSGWPPTAGQTRQPAVPAPAAAASPAPAARLQTCRQVQT